MLSRFFWLLSIILWYLYNPFFYFFSFGVLNPFSYFLLKKIQKWILCIPSKCISFVNVLPARYKIQLFKVLISHLHHTHLYLSFYDSMCSVALEPTTHSKLLLCDSWTKVDVCLWGWGFFSNLQFILFFVIKRSTFTFGKRYSPWGMNTMPLWLLLYLFP